MTRYELLTFLHIGSAIIWLGAGFLLLVLIFGAEREGDHTREAGYHRDVGWLAPRLFIPASMATMIFGILLVIDGPWTFGMLWVTLGLIGWLASFLTGILYFKPEGEALGAMVAERGPDDPELRRRLHRVNVVDRMQVVVLFFVVFDMVVKPTGDDTGLLIVCAALLGGWLALGFSAMNKGAPDQPSAA